MLKKEHLGERGKKGVAGALNETSRGYLEICFALKHILMIMTAPFP